VCCCSGLQCATVCCIVLQCIAVYCSVLQRVAKCGEVLQCAAVRARPYLHVPHVSHVSQEKV